MVELRRVNVSVDKTSGGGEPGVFYHADSAEIMPELLERYAGKIQMVYLDPPFATGRKFDMRMRVGAKDWKSGAASFTLPAYEDNLSTDDYLNLMRRVLTGARELLKDTGTIFLHIDSRMHAYLKIIMDELFGMKNMLNEIIWTYQTGGRAKNYFSRKHDTILFYRKTPRYYFDMKAVEVIDPGYRTNHMKKGVDADGRPYRSIKSGGKTYTYYDDNPVFPSDVWSDVSHMQQRDPQRTGYDNQKPLGLMHRIIKCSTRPGDTVCDLFAGSGSTLDAAHGLDRAFVASDISPMSMYVVRKRLCTAPVEFRFEPDRGSPSVKLSVRLGIGHYIVTLEDYRMEPGLADQFSGMDAVDNWSVGYVKGETFSQEAAHTRSRSNPELNRELWLPSFEGTAAVRIGDILGRNFYYVFDKDGIK
ncbi:MAG: site-specific DNA-methyltransferase [Clostridia bacterium]|nr:site-specific DNA-methyltransferase [Clostridia bacterium]